MKEIFFNLDSGCGISAPKKLTAAVIPACRGAGASFICGQMLQHGLPDGGTPDGLRTLVEMGSPYFYDALNFTQRFGDRTLHFFPQGQSPEQNSELGFNWYVKNPAEHYDPQMLLSFAQNAPGNLVLLDCSGLSEDPFLEKILPLADRIYLVTDPLPTRLLKSRETMLRLLSLRPDLHILVNKYNRGVYGGELTRFLGTGNYLVQEMLPAERIYRAEYNSQLP